MLVGISALAQKKRKKRRQQAEALASAILDSQKRRYVMWNTKTRKPTGTVDYMNDQDARQANLEYEEMRSVYRWRPE